MVRESEAAIKVSREEFNSFRWMEKYPHLIVENPDEKLPSSHFALAWFFDMPYWSRVWVMQELAVSSRVNLSYGHNALEYGITARLLPSILSSRSPFPAQKANFMSYKAWRFPQGMYGANWAPLIRIAAFRGEELQRREQGLLETPSWYTWKQQIGL